MEERFGPVAAVYAGELTKSAVIPRLAKRAEGPRKRRTASAKVKAPTDEVRPVFRESG